MANYYPQRERISTGLEGFEGVKRRRQKLCASQKTMPYSWLRLDPCIEAVIGEGEAFPDVRTSASAAEVFYGSIPYAGRGKESFMVMALDNRHRAVGVFLSSLGGRSSADVDLVLVLQSVILVGASAFIMAHNHPSGSLEPSPEDVALTNRVSSGARTVALRLLDSLVLNDKRGAVFSFADNGLLSVERM